MEILVITSDGLSGVEMSFMMDEKDFLAFKEEVEAFEDGDTYEIYIKYAIDEKIIHNDDNDYNFEKKLMEDKTIFILKVEI